MDVLYQDDDVIAVSKPAGQPVVPGRGASARAPLVEEVTDFLGRKAFVVHRLDAETSGLVLFAKSAAAHRHLSLEFEGRRVAKTYWAAVQGRPPAEGQVDRPLRRFGSGRMGVSPGGKPALTRYRVLERFPGAALLEVAPLTGRQHQIRVHLYAVGHPVLGETRYGKDFPVGGIVRLMLHARALSLRGPDGKLLNLAAEPPRDFQEVLEGLRKRPG